MLRYYDEMGLLVPETIDPFTGYRYYSASHAPVDREREGYVVEHHHQQALQRGQAVVGLASQSEPFLFQFDRDRFA